MISLLFLITAIWYFGGMSALLYATGSVSRYIIYPYVCFVLTWWRVNGLLHSMVVLLIVCKGILRLRRLRISLRSRDKPLLILSINCSLTRTWLGLCTYPVIYQRRQSSFYPSTSVIIADDDPEEESHK